MEEVKRKISEKAKNSAIEFNKELKKSINTALIAAFGFIIALAWRDVIIEYVDKITSVSPLQGKLVTALIVTLVSVIGMIIVTKFISVKE